MRGEVNPIRQAHWNHYEPSPESQYEAWRSVNEYPLAAPRRRHYLNHTCTALILLALLGLLFTLLRGL